ncbi:redoxin domain-containing protein [Mesorhizobium sp. WSM3224]|uniref:redoxin domain-containing protein n=1 Tax=Mesorhizobium sp. WSM3224 TaxID=1040986 RepID=UPI002474AD6A|nr:redoxin domain-containing protein [Mesorhizobium sp. WSM3224]
MRPLLGGHASRRNAIGTDSATDWLVLRDQGRKKPAAVEGFPYPNQKNPFRPVGLFEDIEKTQGHALNFPMLADTDKKVANLYGMIHAETDPNVTVRAVYVIDPNKKIRLSLTYPPSAGRNFSETLRAIDRLQLTDNQNVSTPVNWEPDQPVIISLSLTDPQAKERFPQGWTELRPCLRMAQLQD